MKRYAGFLFIIMSGCESVWFGHTSDNPDHCSNTPSKCVSPQVCDSTSGMCITPVEPPSDTLTDCDAKSLSAAIRRGHDAASSSVYRIKLMAGCVYHFDGPDNFWYGPNALPAIDYNVRIDGQGSSLDHPASVAAPFRFFYVAGVPNGYLAPGKLTLVNMILHGGRAAGGNGGQVASTGGGGGGAGLGGAIFSHGDVELLATSFVDNTAQGGQGGQGLANPTLFGGGGGGGLGGNGGSSQGVPTQGSTQVGTGGGGWNADGCADGTGGSVVGGKTDCRASGEGGHTMGAAGKFTLAQARATDESGQSVFLMAGGGSGGGCRSLGGRGGSSDFNGTGNIISPYLRDGGGGGEGRGKSGTENATGGGGGAGFVGNGGGAAPSTNLGGGGGATGGGGGGGSSTMTNTGGGGGGGGGVGGGGGGGGPSLNQDDFSLSGGGGGGGFGGGGGGGSAGGNGGFGGGGGAGQPSKQVVTGGSGGFGGGKASPQRLADGTTPIGGGGGGGMGAGGAIFIHQGTLTAANSTFLGNSARGGDRGLVSGSTPDSGSGSGFGGAIFALNATVTLINVTAVDNVAAPGAMLSVTTNLDPNGGGNGEGRSVYLLALGAQMSGALTLKNSILGSIAPPPGGVNALQATTAVDVVINNNMAETVKLDASLPNLIQTDIVSRGFGVSQLTGGVRKGAVGFTLKTGVEGQRWYLMPNPADASQLAADTSVCLAQPVLGVDEAGQQRLGTGCTLGAIELPPGTAIGSTAVGCSLSPRGSGRQSAGLGALLLGLGLTLGLGALRRSRRQRSTRSAD